MEPTTEPARTARRSAGEWLFQLTTITIGVLIALSFDAVLKWNADRALLDEARATIALEIADNRRALEGHLALHDERVAMVDNGLKLLAELDSGVEPTIHSVPLDMHFPSLNDAGWQSAERTSAIALMQYSEVQRLADLYAIQTMFTDTLPLVGVAASQVSALMNAPGDPFAVLTVRDLMRARLIELRAHLELGQQIGRQLLDGYTSHQTEHADPGE